MGRKTAGRLVFLALLCVSVFVLSGCGEEEASQQYHQFDCYSKNQITIDDRFGIYLEPDQPTVKCDHPDAIGDIFLYALRYNESDPNKLESLNDFENRLGCARRGTTIWGNEWKEFKRFTISDDPQEKILILVCGWTKGNTQLNNEVNGAYQGRVANLFIGERLGYEVQGPACGGTYSNGWFYRHDHGSSIDGGMQGLCVVYYEGFESGCGTNPNTNATVCVDVNIVPPAPGCDNDGVCTKPWETEGTCGDCSTPCEQRAIDIAGEPTYDQIYQCQGDLNSPGFQSRSFACKMCPKTWTGEGFFAGRDWLPNSWAFPYSMAQGSYSTADNNVGWGCVNVIEGSPFNCGVCGFKEAITEANNDDPNELLAGGFCRATLNSRSTFCADPQERSEWRCVDPEDGGVRGNPGSSPWFSLYAGGYANPSYFYTVSSEGSGFKSTVVPVACSDPGVDPTFPI